MRYRFPKFRYNFITDPYKKNKCYTNLLQPIRLRWHTFLRNMAIYEHKVSWLPVDLSAQIYGLSVENDGWMCQQFLKLDPFDSLVPIRPVDTNRNEVWWPIGLNGSISYRLLVPNRIVHRNIWYIPGFCSVFCTDLHVHVMKNLSCLVLRIFIVCTLL